MGQYADIHQTPRGKQRPASGPAKYVGDKYGKQSKLARRALRQYEMDHSQMQRIFKNAQQTNDRDSGRKA